jgi:UDP-N-acetylglucosamine 2-epimerase (non-hydrolysing)
VLTLHRPSNVDNEEAFHRIIGAIVEISRDYPVVFPVHPRTRARIAASAAAGAAPNLILTEPLGYLEFLSLMQGASAILTDSGGIQEEALIIGVPCVTLRWNTERPVTLTGGANVLVGDDPDRIVSEARAALRGERAIDVQAPAGWDGRAADRITDVLRDWFGSKGADNRCQS